MHSYSPCLLWLLEKLLLTSVFLMLHYIMCSLFVALLAKCFCLAVLAVDP